MYEELVKALRQSINWSTADGGIPVGLIYRLTQAADAIEELQAINQRQLLEIAVLSKPRWIPVTEEQDGKV